MAKQQHFGLGIMMAMLIAPAAMAQSAKSVVQYTDAALVDVGDGWTTILDGNLHTSQWKDLTIDVSLETGLFTSTTVRSKNGKEDISYAEAMVQVRVLVDGQEAFPGVVTYDRRYQELMAKFGGIIESCTDADGDGTIVFEDECEITEEELRLVLDTMAAHAFTFLVDDLSSGNHHVQVQARLTTDTGAMAGEADANALVGKGSLTVEEIRLVKDLDLSF